MRILPNYTVAPLPSYKCCPLKGDRLLVTTWAIVPLVKHLSVTVTINLKLDCGMLLRVEALYVPDFGASIFSVPHLIKDGIDICLRSWIHVLCPPWQCNLQKGLSKFHYVSSKCNTLVELRLSTSGGLDMSINQPSRYPNLAPTPCPSQLR